MRFAQACSRVAWDNGSIEGEPSGKHGEHKAVAPEPDLDLLELDVEWKSLPYELMDDILRLPDKLTTLKRQLEVVVTFGSPGPWHLEYFDARRSGFADLGLNAVDKVERLRKVAELTPISDEESAVKKALLKAESSLIHEIREREAERMAKRR